MVRNLSVVDCE